MFERYDSANNYISVNKEWYCVIHGWWRTMAVI